MSKYKIVLTTVDGEHQVATCSDYGDLVNLITNLDKEKYEIVSVRIDNSSVVDYKHFCKTNENLEIGNK